MFKHRYLNLNMGMVKENFVISKCEDEKLWNARGFEKIRKYPIFHYFPNKKEVIMLGRPLTVSEFGIENLIDCKIIDFCDCIGTYGMGGSGFVGFKFNHNGEMRWLVYCIWLAGEHIILDNRILTCHSKFADKYNPYIDYENPETLDNLKNIIKDMTIKNIDISDNEFTMTLTDSNSDIHTMHTEKESELFPEQAGTGLKRKSFKNGIMNDYWLIIYDKTELMV